MTAASDPFRDLFVELPRAVFEALQGIGEAAVTRATERMRRPIGRRWTAGDVLREQLVGNHLRSRYGWQSFEAKRLPDRCETRIYVWLGCHHRHVIDLPDQLLEHTGRPAFEAMLDALDREAEQARRCYCVQREVLA